MNLIEETQWECHFYFETLLWYAILTLFFLKHEIAKTLSIVSQLLVHFTHTIFSRFGRFSI